MTPKPFLKKPTFWASCFLLACAGVALHSLSRPEEQGGPLIPEAMEAQSASEELKEPLVDLSASTAEAALASIDKTLLSFFGLEGKSESYRQGFMQALDLKLKLKKKLMELVEAEKSAHHLAIEKTKILGILGELDGLKKEVANLEVLSRFNLSEKENAIVGPPLAWASMIQGYPGREAEQADGPTIDKKIEAALSESGNREASIYKFCLYFSAFRRMRFEQASQRYQLMGKQPEIDSEQYFKGLEDELLKKDFSELSTQEERLWKALASIQSGDFKRENFQRVEEVWMRPMWEEDAQLARAWKEQLKFSEGLWRPCPLGIAAYNQPSDERWDSLLQEYGLRLQRVIESSVFLPSEFLPLADAQGATSRDCLESRLKSLHCWEVQPGEEEESLGEEKPSEPIGHLVDALIKEYGFLNREWLHFVVVRHLLEEMVAVGADFPESRLRIQIRPFLGSEVKTYEVFYRPTDEDEVKIQTEIQQSSEKEEEKTEVTEEAWESAQSEEAPQT